MRSSTLDTLKGFLIYMVVLGHTIQISDANFDSNIFFKIIYSFHMPFFFLISGYLAALSLERHTCTIKYCIIDKFVYLVVPFILWYFLYFFLSHNFDIPFQQYMISLINSVDRGLWYLWVLFILYILLFLASFISKKYNFNTNFLLFFFIAFIPITPFLGFYLVKWYLIFFLFGMFIRQYKTFFSTTGTNIKFFLILITVSYIFTVLYFWQRNYSAESLFPNEYIFMGFKLIVAVLGMYVFYKTILQLESFKQGLFQKFGKNSLGIYILNFPIIGILSQYVSSSHFIFIILVSLMSLFFSHYLSFYLSKIKYVALLFGVKK